MFLESEVKNSYCYAHSVIQKLLSNIPLYHLYSPSLHSERQNQLLRNIKSFDYLVKIIQHWGAHLFHTNLPISSLGYTLWFALANKISIYQAITFLTLETCLKIKTYLNTPNVSAFENWCSSVLNFINFITVKNFIWIVKSFLSLHEDPWKSHSWPKQKRKNQKIKTGRKNFFYSNKNVK